ncbi:hypothetical protein PR002_g20661 [Phytophthora rubi]|uniref:Uncharacterized protein n=1 Tax=Phytophthora rubi TaxID=129364 RepID=A0A6A3JA06_9STRA|nr:hypothetical protein PR002_g20661 [Phytophthora rubi]
MRPRRRTPLCPTLFTAVRMLVVKVAPITPLMRPRRRTSLCPTRAASSPSRSRPPPFRRDQGAGRRSVQHGRQARRQGHGPLLSDETKAPDATLYNTVGMLVVKVVITSR